MDNVWIFLVAVVLFIVVIAIDTQQLNKVTNEQCINIGYEGYKVINRMEYCEESNGNLHYIDMDCKGAFYWRICSLREISVGNVRVVENT